MSLDRFLDLSTSSFTELVAYAAPELLPGRRTLPGDGGPPARHGTTVVALACHGGVVMAADRRETVGNVVANRRAEKLVAADAYTLAGAAGTSAFCAELLRLFQLELEHYEKIEGAMLSLDGKAHRLAGMIRDHLGWAMRGLAVVPLLAGFDLDAADPARAGRIFSFDTVGSHHEQPDYAAVGSGSLFATSALKKRYRTGLSVDEAVRLAVEALYDAADDDTATGGPDLTRKIYPVIMTATADGTRRLTDQEAAAVAEAVVAGREANPGG